MVLIRCIKLRTVWSLGHLHKSTDHHAKTLILTDIYNYFWLILPPYKLTPFEYSVHEAVTGRAPGITLCKFNEDTPPGGRVFEYQLKSCSKVVQGLTYCQCHNISGCSSWDLTQLDWKSYHKRNMGTFLVCYKNYTY